MSPSDSNLALGQDRDPVVRAETLILIGVEMEPCTFHGDSPHSIPYGVCIFAHGQRVRRSMPVATIMAIYLPYTELFLTAEVNGEQERCLAEIARLVYPQTKVQSYDDFCAGLLIPTAV